MPRSLSPTFLAQLTASSVLPVLFVKLVFANETLYLFGGTGQFSSSGPAYNALSTFPYGTIFTGLGELGKVSAVPQTSKIQAQSVTFSLSGIPSDLVLDAINEVRTTGTATLWLGFFNPSTGALITDPAQIFAGALDVPTVEDSGETCTISITAENTLLALNEAPQRLFDDMDQQIYYPGDLGFWGVDSLPNMALFWPAPTTYQNPWPVDMLMSPSGADIAVGGTVTIEATINYSDGSYFTQPSTTGSGTPWLGNFASSNPAVATVDFGVVTGISPGIALIICRTPYPSGNAGPPPQGERRCACVVIVHS